MMGSYDRWKTGGDTPFGELDLEPQVDDDESSTASDNNDSTDQDEP